MGGCYSVHLLLVHDIEKEKSKAKQKVNHNCIICWDEISQKSGKYVKCGKCKILLHDVCAQQYKLNLNPNPNPIDNTIYCPHCKFNNSLFRYDNEIYDCKKL